VEEAAEAAGVVLVLDSEGGFRSVAEKSANSFRAWVWAREGQPREYLGSKPTAAEAALLIALKLGPEASQAEATQAAQEAQKAADNAAAEAAADTAWSAGAEQRRLDAVRCLESLSHRTTQAATNLVPMQLGPVQLWCDVDVDGVPTSIQDGVGVGQVHLRDLRDGSGFQPLGAMARAGLAVENVFDVGTKRLKGMKVRAKDGNRRALVSNPTGPYEASSRRTAVAALGGKSIKEICAQDDADGEPWAEAIRTVDEVDRHSVQELLASGERRDIPRPISMPHHDENNDELFQGQGNSPGSAAARRASGSAARGCQRPAAVCGASSYRWHPTCAGCSR